MGSDSHGLASGLRVGDLLQTLDVGRLRGLVDHERPSSYLAAGLSLGILVAVVPFLESCPVIPADESDVGVVASSYSVRGFGKSLVDRGRRLSMNIERITAGSFDDLRLREDVPQLVLRCERATDLQRRNDIGAAQIHFVLEQEHTFPAPSLTPLPVLALPAFLCVVEELFTVLGLLGYHDVRWSR